MPAPAAPPPAGDADLDEIAGVFASVRALDDTAAYRLAHYAIRVVPGLVARLRALSHPPAARVPAPPVEHGALVEEAKAAIDDLNECVERFEAVPSRSNEEWYAAAEMSVAAERAVKAARALAERTGK